MSPEDAKQQAQVAVDRILGLDGVTWSSNTDPTATDCVLDAHDTRGVVFSWVVRGSAAASPDDYAAKVRSALDDLDIETSTSAPVYSGVTINRVVSHGTQSPAIAVSASTDNTSLTVDSVCVPGDFEDYS